MSCFNICTFWLFNFWSMTNGIECFMFEVEVNWMNVIVFKWSWFWLVSFILEPILGYRQGQKVREKLVD